MPNETIPQRKCLTNFIINGIELEFWLEGVADIWVCKRYGYREGRWKVCGIVDGSFVRYPGLPTGLGIRLTTESKILEIP